MRLTFFLFLILVLIGGTFIVSRGQVQNIAAPLSKVDLSFGGINSSVKEDQDFRLNNIEQVFQKDHQWVATLSAEKVVTMIATGDVIPARSVNVQTLQRKDFKWAFLKTADFLNSGDITFINLETPLLKNCPPTQEGMSFCGDSGHIEGLKYGGVDVASLANNHAGNHGVPGVKETVDLLNSNGILTTGVTNQPTYKQVKGVKFAFLGFSDIEKTPSVSDADEEKIKQGVAEARKNADVVVVTYHWGTEYKSQPDQRQIDLGHLTIDSGADLVIGNHPHWIQPIEMYKGKLITYAHGNFIFDQEWSEKTKLGVVGRYTFYDKKLVDVEYLPVQIVNYGQPYFLENESKDKILDGMHQESVILESSLSASLH